MIDPVAQDIYRHLNSLDRAEAIEDRADSLWYQLDRHEMFDALTEGFENAEDGGVSLFHAVAHLASSHSDTQQAAMCELFELVKELTKPTLLKKAEEQIDNGQDEWGDCDDEQ
jgi:hypothetical protein